MFDKITIGNWITVAVVAAGLVSAWALVGYRLDKVELTEDDLKETIKSVMGNTVSISAFDKVADELGEVHLKQVETTAILNISVGRIDSELDKVWKHIEDLQLKEHGHE